MNDGRDDVARAVAELAERLPEPLLGLAGLAYNYLWSWVPDGPALFRDIDPALWQRGGENPRWLVEALPPHRLRDLARDDALVARVQSLAGRLAAELERPARPGPLAADRPVVYFCSEFAVHASLPLYGGGLGVLAGDVLKTASDLALPLVGVGLLYRQGYFHQRLDADGWQHEFWTTTQFERLPIVLVTGPDRRPVTVDVEVRERVVRVQIWRVDVGRVPLYLLDTDRDDNHPVDRWITARLYIGDRHVRLAQYAILGVGGVRALAALGVRPGLVHLNEGHAALGGIERVRALVAAGRPVEAALAAVRDETVFTTHTPVAAGNEWYRPEEVEPVLGRYAAHLGPMRAVFDELARARGGAPDAPVSITPLALHLARAANGVSRRHGEVARAMWREFDGPPIGHVTNGVHTTTWMSAPMQALLDRRLAPDWRDRLLDGALWNGIADLSDGELWGVRNVLRAALVEHAREQSVRDRAARGEAPDYVEAAARVFDPNALTIGFARRVATYKRLHLLTRQLERGLRLLGDAARPIQIVIAGKAHPQDLEAKEALRAIMQARHAPFVGGRIVYLEDYDLAIAPRIVAGADVWVNVPRPPLEASGTSGMKAALNGGLNLSVLDGWWAEADDGESGWSIATPDADAQAQDDHDAGALLDLLEHDVIPLFYERGPDGVPHRWLARVKRSMGRFIPAFSAERMLRDYVEVLYRR